MVLLTRTGAGRIPEGVKVEGGSAPSRIGSRRYAPLARRARSPVGPTLPAPTPTPRGLGPSLSAIRRKETRVLPKTHVVGGGGGMLEVGGGLRPVEGGKVGGLTPALVPHPSARGEPTARGRWSEGGLTVNCPGRPADRRGRRTSRRAGTRV